MVARGGSVEAGKKRKRSLEKEIRKAKRKQKKAERELKRERKIWKQAMMSKLRDSSSNNDDDGMEDIDQILAITDGYDMEKCLRIQKGPTRDYVLSVRIKLIELTSVI